MKHAFRIAVALIAFLLGITAFSFWSALQISLHQSLLASESNQIPPVNIKGKVYLYFSECAGERAVFILENQTDHPIYAMVQRADFWKEYKNANMEWGVHFIEYKAPSAKKFEDSSYRWDAVIPFKMIPPYARVKYGIDLWRGQGEYKIQVPYLEDAEVARRLDEDFPAMIKQDFGRVKASWKKVESDVVTNSCQ